MIIAPSSIQIAGSLFILFAWSRVFLRFRDDTVSFGGLIFWSLLWLAIAVVLFLPQTTEIVADQLGIARGIDAFVYPSIVILFYMVYRVYVKMESIEREITKIVREDSLSSIKDLSKTKK